MADRSQRKNDTGEEHACRRSKNGESERQRRRADARKRPAWSDDEIARSINAAVQDNGDR